MSQKLTEFELLKCIRVHNCGGEKQNRTHPSWQRIEIERMQRENVSSVLIFLAGEGYCSGHLWGGEVKGNKAGWVEMIPSPLAISYHL